MICIFFALRALLRVHSSRRLYIVYIVDIKCPKNREKSI